MDSMTLTSRSDRRCESCGKSITGAYVSRRLDHRNVAVWHERCLARMESQSRHGRRKIACLRSAEL